MSQSRSARFLYFWLEETLNLDHYPEWDVDLIRDLTRMCFAEAAVQGITSGEIKMDLGCDLEVLIHQAMANPPCTLGHREYYWMPSVVRH